MTPSQRIIEKFGGLHPMARILTKHLAKPVAVSTIQYWSECGYIPARRQQDVLRVAEAEGITITPADFFEVEAAE